MSPSNRERAYARRRHEKWQQRQAARWQEEKRAKRTAGIVFALSALALAVVFGVITWQNRTPSPETAFNADASASPSASSAAAASASLSPGASASGTSSSSATAASPCSAPPAPPASPKQFDKAPEPALAEAKTWKWALETSCGPIAISLDGAKAPQAVASTIFLSREGFYDSVPCHRLTTEGIYVLQCGDPTGTGTGTPGYRYGPVENAPKDNVYKAGTIAMARAGGDGSSMGSQFFIVYKDSTIPSDAAGGYSVIGSVEGGMATVEKIAAGGVSGGSADGAPARAVSITSSTIS